MKKIIVRNIAVLVCVAGFVLMLGTAGASDCNMISFKQIIIRGMISIAMMFGGFSIARIMDNAIFYSKKRK